MEQPIHFPAHLRGAQLLEYLEAHADETSISSYVRPLSPDEIADHRTKYVDAGLEKADIEEELKQIKAEMKIKLDDIKERFKTHGRCVKTKSIEERGKTFIFKDYELERVYEYTEHGQLINDRRMQPEDRQRSINFNSHTA